MIRSRLALLAGMLIVSSGCVENKPPSDLAKRIPFFEQRLNSTRWEVRYCLLSDLTGRDEETKRALESLVLDKNPKVANQALVRYLNNFVYIDKSLFDPKIYAPDRFPVTNLPAQDPNRALVDYCLGRKSIPRKDGIYDDMLHRDISVLNAEKRDYPHMYDSLTIVGILGHPEDAVNLYPFLESTNDYVILGAAKALIRLGDKTKALEALSRMTELSQMKEKDSWEHFHYIVQALWVLKEVDYQMCKKRVSEVLATIDRSDGIPPNVINGFLLMASEVREDVWK